MGEVTEKIYCCDRDDNDNALSAAILAGDNRKDEWKLKQEEEEKQLAEQYGMPYEKENNEEENSIK